LSSRRICRNCGAVYNTRFLKPKVDGVCDKCGGPLYQRSDDKPAVIKRRIQVYQEQTSPILKHYKEKNVTFVISSIKALETPPETIVEEIIKELNKLNLT
jgi:adenylate kinase